MEEGEAVRWIQEYCVTRDVKIDPDAARELVDALGGDMMMVSNELEKLILYVGEKKRITLGDVETMVLAAKQRSLYELTDAISAHDRTRALEMLDAILSSGDGDEAAIGHLYMLAKTFRQMLVILERNVRDQRMLWAALWQGFRVPPFAADDIIRQARRYKSKRELTRAIRLVAKTDLALALQSSQQALRTRKTDPRPHRRAQARTRMDAGRIGRLIFGARRRGCEAPRQINKVSRPSFRSDGIVINPSRLSTGYRPRKLPERHWRAYRQCSLSISLSTTPISVT